MEGRERWAIGGWVGLGIALHYRHRRSDMDRIDKHQCRRPRICLHPSSSSNNNRHLVLHLYHPTSMRWTHPHRLSNTHWHFLVFLSDPWTYPSDLSWAEYAYNCTSDIPPST